MAVLGQSVLLWMLRVSMMFLSCPTLQSIYLESSLSPHSDAHVSHFAAAWIECAIYVFAGTPVHFMAHSERLWIQIHDLGIRKRIELTLKILFHPV
jgi:hypothetical protein